MGWRAINFWPSVVPVLPIDLSYRSSALVVAISVVTALPLLVRRDVADFNNPALA